MRMLTAVLKNEQIQEFLVENEDSAFDHLKYNFKIEDIYNSIIENINYYIQDDNLEASFESIKEFSRNYTLNILNEEYSPVISNPLKDFSSVVDGWVDGAFAGVITAGKILGQGVTNLVDSFRGVPGASVRTLGEGSAKALESGDKHELFRLAQTLDQNKSFNSNSAGAEPGVFGSLVEKLGLRKLWDEYVSPLMVEHPKLTPAIASIGLLGIVYIAYKKKSGKK